MKRLIDELCTCLAGLISGTDGKQLWRRRDANRVLIFKVMINNLLNSCMASSLRLVAQELKGMGIGPCVPVQACVCAFVSGEKHIS